MRFLLRLIINAFALWLTTLIVSGVSVRPYASGTTAAVLTFLLIALIFGIVNAVIGTIIRIVALPLYILTLGLISLILVRGSALKTSARARPSRPGGGL